MVGPGRCSLYIVCFRESEGANQREKRKPGGLKLPFETEKVELPELGKRGKRRSSGVRADEVLDLAPSEVL